MANVLNLFPSRIRFVNEDGTLTPEAYRTLQTLLVRVGGPISESITEIVASLTDAQTAIGVIDAEILAISSEVGNAPIPLMPVFQDPLLPPQSCAVVEALQSDINALRETVAALTTQINDLKQGKL